MQSLRETITSHKNNYNLIRLVLASSVIFYHSFLLANQTRYDDFIDEVLRSHGDSIGNLAVGCFFFLSGIFVSQSFHRDGSPVNFFIRRFCRLWPGLFVCLLVTAVISCLLSQGLHAIYYLINPNFYEYILDNATFNSVWNIIGVFEGRPNSGINGSIHTLPTEVKMYGLLLIFGCLTSFRKLRPILLTALLLLLGAVLHFKFFIEQLGLTPPDALLVIMFFSGVLTYTFASYVKPYLVIGVISFTLMFITQSPWNIACFFSFAVWVMIFVRQLKGLWKPKSDLSYGIYIYGWPSQQFVTSFLSGINPYLHTVLALLLATGFAAVSWVAIEEPAMRFGRTLIAARMRVGDMWASADGAKLPRTIEAWPPLAITAVLFLCCVILVRVTAHFDFNPVQPLNVHIVDFGPKTTRRGQGFNIQPGGEAALWLTLDVPPPENARIVFDGHRLETSAGQNSLTAKVPRKCYAQRGEKNITIEVRHLGLTERAESVTFQVLE